VYLICWLVTFGFWVSGDAYALFVFQGSVVFPEGCEVEGFI